MGTQQMGIDRSAPASGKCSERGTGISATSEPSVFAAGAGRASKLSACQPAAGSVR